MQSNWFTRISQAMTDVSLARREADAARKRADEVVASQRASNAQVLSQLEKITSKNDDLGRRIEQIQQAQARAADETEYLKRRLYEYINESATPLYDSIVGKRTRAGLKMFIDARDFGSGSNIITDGLIEPDVNRLLPKIVKPGGVFLDVGANFGYYTLYAAMLGGPKGRVFSFEANPYLTPLIERSVYVNGFPPRVKLFQNAVSDKPGKAQFGFDIHAPGGGGLASGGSVNPAIQKVEVDCARIDDLLDADVIADCIKIDVEGHEFEALRGMEGLLRRSPDVSLILEYFPDMHGGGGEAIAMIDYLASLGFSVWRVNGVGFLEDVTREELMRNDAVYLLAARKRPNDREIKLDKSALQLVNENATKLTAKVGEWLVLGPYWPLAAGPYEVVVEGDITGELELVTTQEFGVPMSSRRITQSGQPLGMAFSQDIRYFSIIVRAMSENASLRLDRIVVRDLK